MPADMQTDLWDPTCPALDPTPGWENSECQSDLAHHAEAKFAVGRAPPQTIHALPAGRSQVSQSAEPLL